MLIVNVLYSCCRVIIITIIIVLTFYFIEQQYNYNTNISDVDVAFIFAETRRKTSVLFLLTTACRYFSDISPYKFGKMFIALSHGFKTN